MKQKHFDECNEYIREKNDEDAKGGYRTLLKEVVRPAVATSLGDYIDVWLSREAMSVTGIPATAIPIEDQIRFTYPRREGGFGFTRIMDQVHGAYVALFMESLYPEGLSGTADVDKDWEGYGLRAISSVANRYLPHHSHTSRMANVREVRQRVQGLLPFSEVIKYFQPYDFDKIDDTAPESLRTFMNASKQIAEMPHIRNLMLNNSIFRTLRSSIPGGKDLDWVHHPEWLGPTTRQHLREHGESRDSGWNNHRYTRYDMNHLDNGPQEFGQEEQREESRTPDDGAQERNGAIPHFPDGAALPSTTTRVRRSTRIQRNAVPASRGHTSGSSGTSGSSSTRSDPRAAYSSEVSLWSSDRLSTLFLSQSNHRHGYHRRIPSRGEGNGALGSHADESLESLESLVSKFMQVALVFNLAVGSKDRPVDVQFIGPGCSLPILKYRLQRLFNRKIMTSIVSYDIYQEPFRNEKSKAAKFRRFWENGFMSIYSDIPYLLRGSIVFMEGDLKFSLIY